MKGSPADPNRLYASQTSRWSGQVMQRSDDGGKTWEAPGGGVTKSPQGWPVGESNRFVYDTSPETGKPLTTHQFYDGTQHPWEFKRVWHLEPSLTDPDTVYAGSRGRGHLSLHRRRAELARTRRTARPRHRPQVAARGRAACACTPIILDPKDPGRIYIAISAAGAFRTDDGGKTWKPINRGLRSQFLPDQDAEVGHCVHHIAMNRVPPGRALYAEALGRYAQRRRWRFLA